MIDDRRTQDIQGLFDWRNAAGRIGQPDGPPSPVANDDLALALELLSCTPRDLEQFRGVRADAAGARRSD